MDQIFSRYPNEKVVNLAIASEEPMRANIPPATFELFGARQSSKPLQTFKNDGACSVANRLVGCCQAGWSAANYHDVVCHKGFSRYLLLEL